MCGLFGSFPTPNLSSSLEALSFLESRGPDNQSYKIYDSLFFGHTRLSIIAPSSSSNQPFEDISSRYSLIYNGEIYNYQYLISLLPSHVNLITNSDTEVLLYGLIHLGTDFLPHIEGMFAFAFFDSHNSSILIARDSFGIKPLFYSIFNDSFVFSSQVQPIKYFLESTFKTTISDDLNGIYAYMARGSVQQPKTIYKNIHSLEPGSFIRYYLDQPFVKGRYIKPLPSSSLTYCESYDSICTDVGSRILKLVELNTVSDVDVGLLLSGGIDSTLILATAKYLGISNINTFTIGFDLPGFPSELNQARTTSSFYDTNHFEYTFSLDELRTCFSDYIKSLDQPSFDGFNTYLISRFCSQHVSVALSGVGGDELFFGYSFYRNFFTKRSKYLPPFAHSLVSSLHNFLPTAFTSSIVSSSLRGLDYYLFHRSYFSPSSLKRILSPAFNGFTNLYESIYHYQFEEDPLTPLLSSTCPITDFGFLDLISYLPNTILRDIDNASMSNSLELRPFFLDRTLFNLVKKLSVSSLYHPTIKKSLLLDSLSFLELPPQLITRPKLGFELPYKYLLNTIFNEHFLRLVETKYARSSFSATYLRFLQLRIHSRSCRRSDWLVFVLLSWEASR